MNPRSVFLIAGEPSGDVLGARLMAALRDLTGGEVSFSGVGGERMRDQGLSSLFPMTELAHFGLLEVLPHVRALRRRIAQTTDAIIAARPDVVVTIDSPGFTMRVARRVREAAPEIVLVHYVAPSVWAWKPGRAKKYARVFDHLLALLPFEPPYFLKEGLACDFVGHPVVEGAESGDGRRFRRERGISETAPLLVVLPGSRRGEVTRLLPIFGETVRRLRERRPDLVVVVPTVETVRSRVRAATDTWPGGAIVIEGERDRRDAFAAARAALAASGTISLELALARLPAVIAYRLNPITYRIAKALVRVKWVNLVNIMLDRGLVPELLQGLCRPDTLAAATARLLDDEAARHEQITAADTISRLLGADDEPPSRRAARVVLSRSRGDAAATPTSERSTAMNRASTKGFQLLHTMIRVLDLDKSIDFYTRLLGMRSLRRADFEEGRFTLAFLGYGEEERNTVIELTHNWDRTEPYETGTGFGHLAIAFADIRAACDALAAEGVTITRAPGPMRPGGPSIAFIVDPDGYKIELIETEPS